MPEDDAAEIEDAGRFPRPHDALFRAIFEDERAADALLSALAGAALDLEPGSLRALPSSFVGRDLRRTHADVVFAARVRTGRRKGEGEGEARALYLHLEHRSTPDGTMPERSLGYGLRILERHRREAAEHRRVAAEDTPQPIVLSVVLYVGERPWPGPRSVIERLDAMAAPLPERLRGHVLGGRRLVLDLVREESDLLAALAGPPMLAVGLALLRARAMGGDPEAALRANTEALRRLVAEPEPAGRERLTQLVSYILRSWDVETGALGAVLDTLVGACAEEVVMTTGERLLREGYRRGRAEGLDALRQTVTVLMETRFGPLPDALRSRVALLNQEALLAAAVRVLTATSPEAVLEG